MLSRFLPVKALLTALALAVPAAPALAAYECRTVEVRGASAPELRRNAAEREARRAWEAAARTQFNFNYRWLLAVKTREPSGTNRNGRWTSEARAYPCRVTAVPTGTVMVNPTSADRICANRPNLETAKRHNCSLFYLLGR